MGTNLWKPMRTIRGYASRTVPDRQGDVVAAGAFSKTLAEWAKVGRAPPLLWQHKMDQPIGKIVRLDEDAEGLAMTADLFTGSDRGKHVYDLIKCGILYGLSIGFTPRLAYKNNFSHRVITQADLFEISLVTIPANAQAVVRTVD